MNEETEKFKKLLILSAILAVFLCLCAASLSNDHDDNLLAKNVARTDAKRALYTEEHGYDNIKLKNEVCFSPDRDYSFEDTNNFCKGTKYEYVENQDLATN